MAWGVLRWGQAWGVCADVWSSAPGVVQSVGQCTKCGGVWCRASGRGRAGGASRRRQEHALAPAEHAGGASRCRSAADTHPHAHAQGPVSYTHLTLPTICSV
eukprot:2547615-Rhodomonas_salina.3